MTNPEDIHAALDAYFEGINSERYDNVARLFAEESELIAPGAALQGPDGIETYFSAALGPYPEHLDEPTRVLISGSTATVEIHFKGALASGARLEFDAVDVFDFDDAGKITRLTSWYDSYAVRQQLKRSREEIEKAAT